MKINWGYWRRPVNWFHELLYSVYRVQWFIGRHVGFERGFRARRYVENPYDYDTGQQERYIGWEMGRRHALYSDGFDAPFDKQGNDT